MNTYTQLKESQQREVNSYLEKYAFFAFNEEQFANGLQKLGIEKDQKGVLVSLGGTGGYILKERAKGFKELMDRLDSEKKAALTDPEFAYNMFYTELANHEYGWTGDAWETLDALGITWKDLEKAPLLREALERAEKDVMRATE